MLIHVIVQCPVLLLMVLWQLRHWLLLVMMQKKVYLLVSATLRSCISRPGQKYDLTILYCVKKATR